MNRGRGLLSNLVLLGASISLCLAALELAARHLEQRQPSAGERLALLRENPAGTGSHRLRPHLDVVARVRGRAIRIRTNSHGMRWREVSRPKPSGVTRVAFLGDSFTFGCWSDSIETSFVGRFDTLVGDERTEVLNFGVGGYGADDALLLLREEVAAFRPDYVIFALFNGNDFRDTFLGLRKHLVVDGAAELDPSVLREKLPHPEIEGRGERRVAARDPWLARRLVAQLATGRLMLAATGWSNPWVEFPSSPQFTSFVYWSQYPYPDLALRARRVMLETLAALNDTSSEMGAEFAVASLPFREQVYAVEDSGPGYDIRRPQQAVARWAQDAGVPYLDLLPPLRAHALTHHRPLYLGEDIHFGDFGHRFVGERLAEWFADFRAR